MITLRIKSENGTLECEFTEMRKPYNFHKATTTYFTSEDKKYIDSFQPITLSEEARELLNTNHDLYFNHKLLELSGKETECFEVVRIFHTAIVTPNPHYTYELRMSVPVSENVVAGDGMKSNEILHGKTMEFWKTNAEEDYASVPISVLKYITVLETYASQFKNQPTDDELWDEIYDEILSMYVPSWRKDETINTLKSKFKITRR